MKVHDGIESKSTTYKSKLCVYHLSGKCVKGHACNFAHDPEELSNPKTYLCPVYKEISMCCDNLCPFAHGTPELAYTDRGLKKTRCKYWEAGKCRAGEYCRHAHGDQELQALSYYVNKKSVNNKEYEVHVATSDNVVKWRSAHFFKEDLSDVNSPLHVFADAFTRLLSSPSSRIGTLRE